MSAHHAPATLSELSLTQGGPLYRLESCLHLLAPRKVGLRLGAAVILVTWLPLLLLSLPQLASTGMWDPLLRRSEVHVRLLISLMLFLSGEIVLEQRVRSVTRYLAHEGFVAPAKIPIWHATLARLQELRDAWAPELGLLLGVYGLAFVAHRGFLPAWVIRWIAPTLHRTGPALAEATPALWWYLLISQPFFLFVLMRWLIRWCLFARLLQCLATLHPRIQASHADGAGGLSFLRSPLYALRFVAAGTAFAFMSVWLDEIRQNEADPSLFAHDFLVFIGASMGLSLLPYLAFMKPLLRARQRGILSYSALINRYAQRFDQRWLGPSDTDAELLGSQDFSAFSDLSLSYQVVEGMRTLIPNWRDLRAHLIASTAPFSVIFVIYGDSAADILKRAVLKFIGA